MIVLVPAVVFIGISTPGLGRKSTRWYSLSQLPTFVSLEFSVQSGRENSLSSFLYIFPVQTQPHLSTYVLSTKRRREMITNGFLYQFRLK